MRKCPAVPAKKFPDQTKRGIDGCLWQSRSCQNGFRWFRKAKVTKKRHKPKKYVSKAIGDYVPHALRSDQTNRKVYKVSEVLRTDPDFAHCRKHTNNRIVQHDSWGCADDDKKCIRKNAQRRVDQDLIRCINDTRSARQRKTSQQGSSRKKTTEYQNEYRNYYRNCKTRTNTSDAMNESFNQRKCRKQKQKLKNLKKSLGQQQQFHPQWENDDPDMEEI